MKPILKYFGSKWRICKKYGPPRRDVVIEPFAGGASYSVFWEPKKVILVDAFEPLYEAWSWYLGTSQTELEKLPDWVEHVDDHDIPQGAKNMIGYWLGRGDAKPRPSASPSNYVSFLVDDKRPVLWNESVKRRLIDQLPKVQKLGNYFR